MTTMKVLKFEFKNILRSRWIFGYTLVTLLITAGLNYLTSDKQKVMVSLALILPLLVPMVALTYSTLHWYYNERFTVLLLTQPISRRTVMLSRYFALAMALSLSVVIGLIIPFLLQGRWPDGLTLLASTAVILTFIFVGVALLIATLMDDRLKGIGLALGAWIYLNLIHDGLLLVLLVVFRESPMELAAGIFSSLNPISLSRIVQIMYFDQPLLLGHTGALTRQILTSWKGASLVVVCTVCWIFIPLLSANHYFRRKNL